MKPIKMKQFFITLLILFVQVFTFGQNSFILKSEVGKQEVEVNGNSFSIDSTGTSIPTNYPGFDSFVFKTESSGQRNSIICNFKPDATYSISYACCGSLDLIPTYKLNNDSLKHWDYESDFNKIQSQLMDNPFISIRTRRMPKDSVYAWHADAACMTGHSVLSTNLWEMGVPPKCYYWSNITYITFFKKSEKSNTPQEEQTAQFLGFDNIEIITNFTFRLFDDERFVLTLDEDSKKVKIEYE